MHFDSTVNGYKPTINNIIHKHSNLKSKVNESSVLNLFYFMRKKMDGFLVTDSQLIKVEGKMKIFRKNIEINRVMFLYFSGREHKFPLHRM